MMALLGADMVKSTLLAVLVALVPASVHAQVREVCLTPKFWCMFYAPVPFQNGTKCRCGEAIGFSIFDTVVTPAPTDIPGPPAVPGEVPPPQQPPVAPGRVLPETGPGAPGRLPSQTGIVPPTQLHPGFLPGIGGTH